jgi:hypothetical protein
MLTGKMKLSQNQKFGCDMMRVLYGAVLEPPEMRAQQAVPLRQEPVQRPF